MKFFEEENNSLIFRENGETVQITPWGKDSFRVRANFLGEILEQPGALLEPVDMDTEPAFVVEDEYASITNGKITAYCHVDRWGNRLQITYKNQKDEVLLKEVTNGGALFVKARDFRPLPGGNYRLKVRFESDPAEKLYGMGQYQQEVMNLKGCHLELAHRNSQASVPFYVSSLGYGFLWNNPAIGEVDFGTNITQWTAESSRQMDYWITAGDTPAQLEEAYAAVTGKAAMMPEYGLGFWQCKLRYYNQEQVLKIAREYVRRNIPVDVLVIDFFHWPKCGDWRFDEEYFPNPGEMVRQLHEMGIETMVSVWPQVDWKSENFEEMKQKGLLVRSNSGIDVQMLTWSNNVFMDATNPRTRDYVWEKCRKNYADLGIRTFWLDEAEPEFTGYDFLDYRYHAGAVAEVGNIYPREYARMFYEGQKAMGQEDIVNLIRCAWAGSQRYGALVWSGDIMSSYEDFRKQICAGIHMGLSGIPWWTTDIGGFHNGNIHDPGFKELLVRWFEFGTFCPVMRLHGCRQPETPIIDKSGEMRQSTGADNEVWSYGPEIEEILVGYIHLREAMRPYTRSLMAQAHEKGTPVMRACFYEFPKDPVCWELTDEYMFGPDVLVAPVCHAGAVSRSVYLPEGASWTDARSGAVYDGGQYIQVSAPLEAIPLFLRDGHGDEIRRFFTEQETVKGR